MYIFVFKLELGLSGIWISKILTDTSIFVATEYLLLKSDWETIAQEFFNKRNIKFNYSLEMTEEELSMTTDE
jgi:hypothetical protein